MALALLAPAAGAAPPDEARVALGKALPLLWKAAEGHVEQKTCFACHNQAPAILAFTTARQHGFPLRDDDLRRQTEFIAEFLDTNRENYSKGKGQGGQVDTAGYALLSLELGGWEPDETTAAVVEYFLLREPERDHWRATSNRPPSEASDFTTTFLAVRGLRHWAADAQKERAAKRIEAARGWLLGATPKDTEERVFRLWGLKEAGATHEELKPAVRELAESQRTDGGWGQTEALESDAYATGSALAVLHLTGGLPADDPVYWRGVDFLVRTQRDDGSWLVRSRSKPFQPYYESGFPHGKDQFISAAATGWAAAALALACPPAP